MGLARGLAAVLNHKADLINLSYGEETALPNRGRFIQLANEACGPSAGSAICCTGLCALVACFLGSACQLSVSRSWVELRQGMPAEGICLPAPSACLSPEVRPSAGVSAWQSATPIAARASSAGRISPHDKLCKPRSCEAPGAGSEQAWGHLHQQRRQCRPCPEHCGGARRHCLLHHLHRGLRVACHGLSQPLCAGHHA